MSEKIVSTQNKKVQTLITLKQFTFDREEILENKKEQEIFLVQAWKPKKYPQQSKNLSNLQILKQNVFQTSIESQGERKRNNLDTHKYSPHPLDRLRLDKKIFAFLLVLVNTSSP
eukprot:TRINITY_DN11439_c0_g1_i1.p1 TRINITY_DN11439_c0_g1~~TRINITY_DN11439_c0_g1_i1.p1  ORF type:complete len:115 (+),score=4.74 TRINITY_DN11439_c0_g1_i1:112-456(+)